MGQLRQTGAVPVTFTQSSVVTVKAPDGRWFDVRVVAADGHRPFPSALVGYYGLMWVTVPIYGMYRLMCRAWYVLTRSTRKWVDVVPWGDPFDNRLPVPDRSRPLVRELLPDDGAARRRAEEVARAVSRGEVEL